MLYIILNVIISKVNKCVVSQVTGNTVLHLACGKKEYDTVKLFLEAGAPVDFQNVCEAKPKGCNFLLET